jgi:hypothetical protein
MTVYTILTYYAFCTFHHAAQLHLQQHVQLHEASIIDKLEKMCDIDTDEGMWILKLDVVEDGEALRIEDKGKVGAGKSDRQES